MNTASETPRAGRRVWIGLAVIALIRTTFLDPRQRTVAVGVWTSRRWPPSWRSPLLRRAR